MFPVIARRVAVLSFALCAGAYAQTSASESEIDYAVNPQTAPGRSELGGIHWTVSGGGSYHTDADIDAGGEFNLTRFGFGVGGFVPIDETWSVAFGAAYEYDDYDFPTVTGIGISPWETIHSVRLRATVNYRLDEQWSIFGGPLVTWSGEDGADFGEAFTGGGTVGVGYIHDENFRISAGVFISSVIEDDPIVFPIIRLEWQFADVWTLRSGNFDLGSEGGLGLEVAWQFAQQWELSGGGMYQTRRFRLDEGGLVPNGVGRDSSFPLYVKLAWTPREDLSVYVFGGMVVGGELELMTSGGSTIAEQNYDPMAAFGGRVSFKF